MAFPQPFFSPLPLAAELSFFFTHEGVLLSPDISMDKLAHYIRDEGICQQLPGHRGRAPDGGLSSMARMPLSAFCPSVVCRPSL